MYSDPWFEGVLVEMYLIKHGYRLHEIDGMDDIDTAARFRLITGLPQLFLDKSTMGPQMQEIGEVSCLKARR